VTPKSTRRTPYFYRWGVRTELPELTRTLLAAGGVEFGEGLR